MRSTLRRRFFVEGAAALLNAALLLVTVLWPDWLEHIFGIDPDAGSGLVEWIIAATFLALTVASAAAARLEWRRGLAAAA